MRNFFNIFTRLTAFSVVTIFIMSFSVSKRINYNKINNFPGIKDSIDDDSLKFPFKDYSNNPLNNNQTSPLFLKQASAIKSSVKYDPKTGKFIFYDKIGDINYRNPYYMSFDEFVKYNNKKSTHEYWMERSALENAKGETSLIDRLVNKNLVVPIQGFDRIFGSNTINIKPQGTVELLFGLRVTEINNLALSKELQRMVNFDFDMKIKMGVSGQIGDKLKLGINFDTDATFEFENNMKLAYEGKEDEIIQKIEAGNVTMPLSGSLITGSHSLFGLKTELKFGKLYVTNVFSQQKGESKTIEVAGGATTTPFEITADDYDSDRHYFIAQYFRDRYDDALSDLPIIKSNVNIRKIEVWITNRSGRFENSRNLIAFMDLGENSEHFYANSPIFSVTNEKLPRNNTNNLYQKMVTTYSGIRTISNATTILSGIENFNAGIDYEKVQNARLLSPSEYTFNTALGYISLNSKLYNDEVLAIAYEYENTRTGKIYKVGEFSNEEPVAPQALFLKLIKPTTLSTEFPTWDLMMKNVYSFNAYQVNSQDFRLDVMYRNDKTGSSVNYISEGGINGKVLLKVLNLDKLNKNGEPGADGFFDFIDKVTINATNGKIFFPVVEPFGSYLKKQILAGDETNPELIRIAEQYAFQELYDETQSSARQKAEKNKFFLKGEYRSTGGSEISLNAMNVPEGSVTVTAGAQVLVENQDYTVDYNMGRVTIINQSYLKSGTPIKISLESNSTFNMTTKSMVGTHLDYRFSDNFNIGATVMHLYEKPMMSKVSIGSEPISNTIMGTDINFNQEVPILTNFVDKYIPFVKTKAKSNIDFTGEFAQLIPGHPKVLSKNGYTHIDDFEGAKTTFDLKSPARWKIASTPQGQRDLFPEADSLNTLSYGYNRAKIAWYNINRDLQQSRGSDISFTPDELSDPRVREIYEKELFPDRDPEGQIPPVIYPLNIAYYPEEKGPYNYDSEGIAGISAGMNTNGGLKNPNSRWAGISQALTTNDFEEANIESIEIWVLDPFIQYENGQSNTNGGDLYLNFGNVSEDILRDSRQSFENGLPTSANVIKVDSTVWGRVPVSPRITRDFANEPQNARQFQDVGLDGLSDEDEKLFFSNYLSKVSSLGLSSAAYNKIASDPSNDNYVFFKDPSYNNANASILERYKNYNNQERNSLADETNGITASPVLTPDMEDLNGDYTLTENEAYFQYKIHFSPSEMEVGKNYITDIREAEVDLPNEKTQTVKWYHLKIPLADYQKRIGAIQDFKSIRFVRLFMKDWDEQVVLRFAKFDLVRGSWRKYRLSMLEGTEGVGNPEFTDAQIDVSAVNIEENTNKEPVNYIMPPTITREISPTNRQIQKLNEQAISLKVLNLSDGDARAVYKNTTLDVRQFKRLQMFIHAEAIEGELLDDDDLCAFIRLGSDYRENYYEYEIPLKLTEPGRYNGTRNDPNAADRYIVWPEDNLLDVKFEVFQAVKQERNRRNALNEIALTSEFSMYDTENYTEATGRRVSIIGSPNLSNIRTIMIGIRNRKKENNKLKDDGNDKSAEVWMNELRLEGFKEEGGWATRGRLQANFADFSTIAIAGEYSTPGFGSIEKRVNERQKSTNKSYDFSASTELGKFFPKKYGVRVPVYFGYSESFINPQYDPLNPDIEMNDALSNIKDAKARKEHKRISQDYLKRKSFNITNIKINGNSEKKNKKRDKGKPNTKTSNKKKNRKRNSSNNKPLWHISNFTGSYGFNETYISNINTDHNLLKIHTGAISYNYNVSPKNVKPFGKVKFLRKKAFRIIKDFNFYYLPSMLAFRTDLRKSYNEIQLRNIEAIKTGNYSDTLRTTFDKQFTWNRTYDLRYNLTRSLKFTYSANNQAWIGEPEGRIDRNDEYRWNMYKDSVIGGIRNLGNTTDFHQKADAVWTIPINKLPLLDWTSANARYSADYYWTKGLVSEEHPNIGNTIRNKQAMQLSTQFNFGRVYKKIKYLKKVDNRLGRRRGNKNKKKKYKDIVFTKENLRLKKDRKKTITHNLKTKKVEVVVLDINKKKVAGKTEIIDENRIKFTSGVDIKNVTIKVTGKKEIKQNNPLRVITDYTLYALMSVRNVSINYTANNGMLVPGYKPKSKYLGFSDEKFMAPGWKFITAIKDDNFFKNAGENNWLSGDSLLNTPTVITGDETYNLKATLKPIPGFRIDVTAKRRTSYTQNQYWTNEGGEFIGSSPSETGNFEMSFLSIGSAFGRIDTSKSTEVFEKFLSNRKLAAIMLANQRTEIDGLYNQNLQNLDTAGNVINDFPKGYSPTSQDVLLPAFLSAYSGQSVNSFKTVFSKIPLPNWRVKYDGLTKYKTIKKVFKRITLNHGYNSIYAITNYTSNTGFNENIIKSSQQYNISRSVDTLTQNFIPEFEMGSVTLNERFVPLLGIDMQWKNEMSTKLEYKQSRSIQLSFGNNLMNETSIKEYVIGFGYKIPNLKVPMTVLGQQRLFQSDLNFMIDFKYADRITILRRINEGNNDVQSGQKDLGIKVNADYNLDKVTLRLFYERTVNTPYVSSTPTRKESYMGFSLRFNLANI